MDFWDVVQARYSVRQFDPGIDVSPEEVERLLWAATRAPSAGNRQPWHFYVVRDAKVRRGLLDAAHGQSYVAEAPVVIVVCADAEQSAERYGDRGRQLYVLQDTAAAVENILLGAVALGLGGCWIGAFDEEHAAQTLRLPPRHRPVAMVPIGHPAIQRETQTPRQPLTEVASYIG